MGNQSQEPRDESSSSEQGSQKQSNALTTVLIVALVAALAAIVVLLVVYVFGDSGDGDEGTLPPPEMTVEATVIPPTPEPGDPTAMVIAPKGVNVRTGPGLEYPVIGIAPNGTKLEVVGVSQDRTWWVVNIPGAPGNYGWISEEYVDVQNADSVLVVPAPPVPTPVATPIPTAPPAPDISFTASRTTINAGEKATLSWSVENVNAVYMYPIGDNFENYPTTGQGSMEVQPYITTSYELLTFNRDGTSSSSRIEITVVGGLTSGRWILTSFSTPNSGNKKPHPQTEITARFGVDGNLSASARCNSYNSYFMAFDKTLRIYNVAPSQAWCDKPGGVMEQEGTFLDLMQRASKMSISAGQLTVFDSNGNRILEFVNG